VQGALEQKTILTGGGTDLYVQKPEELHAATLYTLLDKQDLKFIREENGTCHIGAATTVSELLESPLMRSIFPELPRFFKLISSTQIRNMATLGGNIINASPIGDLTIFFLALDSEIVLRNKEQRRTVKLRHFFKGYKSLDLTQGEVLEQLRFVIPQGDFHFNFEKVSKRMHLDIASVNSACLISLENDTIMEAHISMGGVSPVPLYLEKTSAAMNGSHLNVDLLRNVTKVLQEEISPISDVRGSARYKRLLARQLLLVHFAELNPNWVFHDVIMEHPVPS
jgi:xanthine dehydrogenase small subunit